MRSRIHVRRDIIHKDGKTNRFSKAIAVETSGMRKRYGRRVTVKGPCTFIYRPDHPLSCGAKCWAETLSEVIVHAV